MGFSNQQAPRNQALAILSGLFITQVVYSLFQVNMIETPGPDSRSPDELVRQGHAHKNVLLRALRFASFIGIIQLPDEKYSLTDFGMTLLKDSAGSLFDSITFVFAPPLRDSRNKFRHCLQTGEPAFNHVFDVRFFEYPDSNQQFGSPFNQSPARMTISVAPMVPAACDFRNFRTICDPGGGPGAIQKAILLLHCHCKVILYDIDLALKDHVPTETGTRTKIIAGNFFESVPEADCMVLKTVVHDWDDPDSVKIFNDCRNSLKKEGKIILVEQVFGEPFTLMALFYDLHMHVMPGGAERTDQEFMTILNTAGLKPDKIIPTKSPMKILEVPDDGDCGIGTKRSI